MTSAISFIGTYSGIDQTSIDKLMEAERIPLNKLNDKKTDITNKQNAWKDINTRLNSLFEKLKVLQDASTFTAKKSTSTDDNIVSMTANSKAIAGSYKINVSSLATATNVIGGKVLEEGQTITDELHLNGTIKLKNHEGVEIEIQIEDSDSLKTITNKINANTKTTGISSSIIDGRIVLSDVKTGDRNIEVSGTLVEDLKLGTEKEVNIGTNAKFTVNGIEVIRSTNEITDVIENLTINLNKTHQNSTEYEIVNIVNDNDKIVNAVKDFVDQYNSTMQFIEEKFSAGVSGDISTRGVLAGDSSLQILHSTLRRMVTSPIENPNTSIKDISQLGISTTDKSGILKFDQEKLLDSLNKNPDDVINFFSTDLNGEKKGFAPNLNNYIDSYISKSNGVVKNKTESLERSLKDINIQIEIFNTRMQKKQEYYTNMFSKLDTAMMQAEDQMNWLIAQLNTFSTSK
jgi:flagellar hook-associated protein 2